MATVKRRDDILEQIKSAFSTIIMDDKFLQSPERQRELLEHLQQQSRVASRAADRSLERDSEKVEQWREESLKG